MMKIIRVIINWFKNLFNFKGLSEEVKEPLKIFKRYFSKNEQYKGCFGKGRKDKKLFPFNWKKDLPEGQKTWKPDWTKKLRIKINHRWMIRCRI